MGGKGWDCGTLARGVLGGRGEEDREGRRGTEDENREVGDREARGRGREGRRDTEGGQGRCAAGEARLRVAL